MPKTKDIRDSVNAELGFDPLVDDSSITVKHIDGDIALTGTVPPGRDQRAQPPEGRAAGQRLPRRPRAGRCRQYRARAECHRARYALITDDTDVTVDASDGTITLSGHVRTWAEHDVAIDAAWMGHRRHRRPR